MSSVTGVGSRRELSEVSEHSSEDELPAIPPRNEAVKNAQPSQTEVEAWKKRSELEARVADEERFQRADDKQMPFVRRYLQEKIEPQLETLPVGGSLKQELQLTAKVGGLNIGGKSGVEIERTEKGYEVRIEDAAVLKGKLSEVFSAQVALGGKITHTFGSPEEASRYLAALAVVAAQGGNGVLAATQGRSIAGLSDPRALEIVMNPKTVSSVELQLSSSATAKLEESFVELKGKAEAKTSARWDVSANALVLEHTVKLKGDAGAKFENGKADLLGLVFSKEAVSVGGEMQVKLRQTISLSEVDLRDLKKGNLDSIIERHADREPEVTLTARRSQGAIGIEAGAEIEKKVGLFELHQRIADGTLGELAHRPDWKVKHFASEDAPISFDADLILAEAKYEAKREVPTGETVGTLADALESFFSPPPGHTAQVLRTIHLLAR